MKSKNLPDEFPIRYAIVVSPRQKEPSVKDTFAETKRLSLLSQLVTFLKSKPLEGNDLSLQYKSVGYSDLDGNKFFDFPWLNGSEEWAKKMNQFLVENMPGGSYSSGSGSAFRLTLYSYKGMAEIPVSHRILNSKDPDDVVGKLALRPHGYFGVTGLAAVIKSRIQKIQEEGISFWENFRYLNQPSVFYIKIPYSELWRSLDNGCYDGAVTAGYKLEEPTKKFTDEDKIINVAVAYSFEALVTEELVFLEKISTYCKSCLKPLPIKYKGKYCPTGSENIACNRKRARKRKKKQKM